MVAQVVRHRKGSGFGCAPTPAGSVDVAAPPKPATPSSDGERVDRAAGVSGVAGAIRFPPPEVAAASVTDSGRGFPHRFLGSGVRRGEPAWKDHLRASEILSRAAVYPTGQPSALTFWFENAEDARRILLLLGKELGQ